MGVFKSDPVQVKIVDQPLLCQICRHPSFWRRNVQLNTRTAELFSIEWTDSSAVAYVCVRCGYIHWFVPT